MKNDYIKKVLNNSENLSKVTEYIKDIPVNSLDLLAPSDLDDLQRLDNRIKILRTREKERNYVMEIQRSYNLPLRPNESLKETMIRVRLNLLKSKNMPSRNKSSYGSDSLPIDPLE